MLPSGGCGPGSNPGFACLLNFLITLLYFSLLLLNLKIVANKMINKNKVLILSLTTFTLISTFIQVYSLQEFGFVLKSKVTQCFTEKVSKDNFFKIEINTEIHMVKVEYAPPGEHKFGENNVNTFKKSFTAKEDGDFLFCVTSITNNDQKVYLKFALGVSAKDFSEIIKESDLKPINDKVSSSLLYIILTLLD